MKYLFLTSIPLLACFFLAFSNGEGAKNKIAIRFEGIETAGGTVRLALYDRREHFLVEKQAVLYNFKVERPGKLEAVIDDLPLGSYAFAVFLDENNNQKLDKNLLGVPVEPYGFSKKPPSKWRLPTFEEVKFELGQTGQTLLVPLKRWAL